MKHGPEFKRTVTAVIASTHPRRQTFHLTREPELSFGGPDKARLFHEVWVPALNRFDTHPIVVLADTIEDAPIVHAPYGLLFGSLVLAYGKTTKTACSKRVATDKLTSREETNCPACITAINADSAQLAEIREAAASLSVK